MRIDSLADLFAVSLNGLTLDQATITTDGPVVVIRGKATVLNSPDQDVTITLRGQGDQIVPAIDVGFPAMSLRQMSQAGWLPASDYAVADLPDVTFSGLKLTPQAESRVVVLTSSAATTSVAFGISSLPISAAVIQLTLAVPASGPVQNIAATIGGTLAIGGGLPVQITLPRGPFDWQLSASAASPVPLSNGLVDLTSLAERPLAPLLPATLVSLAGIGLTAVAAQFDTRAGTISSLQLGIATSAPWPIIPNPDPSKPAILQISALSVMLSVLSYQVIGGQRATSITGEIAGVLAILDVDVLVRIPIPPTAGGWVLSCYPNIGIPGIGTLATSLSNLVGAGDPSSSFPPGFNDLGNFTIDALEIVFTPSPPTLTNVAFSISSGAPWQLPYVPALGLSDILVDLSIAYPTDSARRAVSGSLTGQVLLGASLYIPVLIQRHAAATNWSLAITYDDLAVGLPDLLQLAGVDAASFRATLPSTLSVVSDLQLNDLRVVYDLSAGRLESAGFTIGLSDPWTIIDGALTVNDLEASLQVANPGQPSQQSIAALSTEIAIGEVAFIFSATNATSATWVFSAALAQGETFNLNTLINWVLTKLQVGVQLPTSFPVVVASAALVRITPSSGAFYASLTSTISWPVPFAQTSFAINNLTTTLDIGAKPTPPATGERPYSFTASGAFVFGAILGAATFSTTNTGGDTVIRVAVSNSATAIRLPSVAKELTSGSQTGSETWQALLPSVPADLGDFGTLSLAIAANLTKNLFLMYGSSSKFGAVAFLAKKLDGTNWGYLAAARLADDFSFAAISAGLAPVDGVLKIAQAGFSIVSADLPSLQDLVKDLPEFATVVALDSTSKAAPLQAGANIYGVLVFSTPLLTNVKAVLAGVEQQPAITLYAFIASAPGQSLFQASLDNFRLASALKFNSIVLQYRPRNSSDPESENRLDLVGDMVVTVDANDYSFHAALTVTSSKATFALASAQELPSPLGMFNVRLKQLALSVEYLFAPTASLEISLAARVGFGAVGQDGQQPVVLDGKLLFVGGAPQITEIALSQPLSIDDFMTTVLPANSWPTGWLKITFVSGRIYYALADGTFFGAQYQRGFHLATQIDVWGYTFTIAAQVQADGVTISGSATSAIDLYVAQLTNPAFAANSSPALTISTVSPNSRFGFETGVTLFKAQVGTASLAYVPASSRFEGSFTYNGMILDTQNPSIGFAWSQAHGFELLSWNLSLLSSAYDYARRISDLSDQFTSGSGCDRLVGMAFDKAFTNQFSVTIDSSSAVAPLATDRSSYRVPLQVTVQVAVSGQAPFLTRSFPTPLIVQAPGQISWSDVIAALANTVVNSLEAIVTEILQNPGTFAAFIAAAGLKKLASKTVSSLLCREVNSSEVETQAETSLAEESTAAEEAASAAEEAALAAEAAADAAAAAGLAATAEGSAGVAAAALGVLLGLVGGLLALFGISKSREQQQAEDAKRRAEEAAERARQAVLNKLKIAGLSLSSSADDTLHMSWTQVPGSGVSYDLSLQQGDTTLASPTGLSEHGFSYTNAQQVQPGLSYLVRVRAVLRASGKTFEGEWQSASLGIVALPAPTNLAVEQVEQQLHLTWSAGSADPLRYEVQVLDSQGTPLAPQPAIALSGTSATVSGLTAGVAYSLAARSRNDTARSLWVRSALTLVSGLTAPQQLSLSFTHSGTAATIHARWQDAQSAVDYLVELRDANGQALNPQPTVVRNGLAADCSGAGLQLGQTYQVRVAVTRASERVWSQPASIALLAQPQPVVGELSYNLATGRVVVTFQRVSGTGPGQTSYAAQLVYGAARAPFGTPTPVADNPAQASLSAELDPSGIPAGPVQAQVQTLSDNPGVAASDWALSSATLTVLGTPPAPALAYDSATQQLRVSWGRVVGALRYAAQLLVDTRPFGTATVVTVTDPAQASIETLLALPADLPQGAVQARVWAVAPDPQSISGAWADSAQLLNRLAAPPISALSYDDDLGVIRVSWQAVPAAGGYSVQLVGAGAPVGSAELLDAVAGQTTLSHAITLSDAVPPGAVEATLTALPAATDSGSLPSSPARSAQALTRLAAPTITALSYDALTGAEPEQINVDCRTVPDGFRYHFRFLFAPDQPDLGLLIDHAITDPAQTSLRVALPVAATVLPGVLRVQAMTKNLAPGYVPSRWANSAGSLTRLAAPEVIGVESGDGTVGVTLAQPIPGASLAQGQLIDQQNNPQGTPGQAPGASLRLSIDSASLPDGSYGLQVRSIGASNSAINSAWQRAAQTVQLQQHTPERLARQLRAEGKTAQQAAPSVRASFQTISAAALAGLLQTIFPESARSLTQLAWAMGLAGYTQAEAGQALGAVQPGAPLAEVAAALKAGYPAQQLRDNAVSLQSQGLSAQAAAAPLRDSGTSLSAVQLGILLSMTFAASVTTPLQLAQALRNAGYPLVDTGDALGQIFPLAPLAETAAAIRQSYQPSDGAQLAVELRTQGLSAVRAAALIKASFGSMTAGDMLKQLLASFPELASAPIAGVWALQQAGYKQNETAAVLGAAYPGLTLPAIALALKSGYPVPALITAAQGLRQAGGTPASAAPALRSSSADLTATQLAIVLSQTFGGALALPLALAQALKGAGYAMNDTSAALGLVYPLMPLAMIAAALRTAYQS